jgi:hypothetical protein
MSRNIRNQRYIHELFRWYLKESNEGRSGCSIEGCGLLLGNLEVINNQEIITQLK